MNIFVGNLLFETNESDLKRLFEGFGSVASVAIVMRKEKKTPKSRGFGFVQMPDEQQALAAIDALNGKEFMGRVLDISPACLKTEAHRESRPEKRVQPKFEAKAGNHLQRPSGLHPALNDGRVRPSGLHPALNDGRVRPSGLSGRYKGGRRTRSYMIRQGLDGIQEEARPRQRSQDNPMRWRKKKDQSKSWQKSPGEHKPWKKPGGYKR